MMIVVMSLFGALYKNNNLFKLLVDEYHAWSFPSLCRSVQAFAVAVINNELVFCFAWCVFVTYCSFQLDKLDTDITDHSSPPAFAIAIASQSAGILAGTLGRVKLL